jgi:hypothetical protein
VDVAKIALPRVCALYLCHFGLDNFTLEWLMLLFLLFIASAVNHRSMILGLD